MHALGARTMLFTNAVGALNPEYAPGDLMLARDHINMIGTRGLFTTAELADRGRARLTGHCYSASVGRALRASATRTGIKLHEGVLMGGKGPSYETAAEVRMARTMGADVACMSTVHEVTLAAHLGCACASVSAITNLATGLSSQPLTHEEVTEVAGRASSGLMAIFDGYFAQL
jgi:purine-nucleoside phosphorylase